MGIKILVDNVDKLTILSTVLHQAVEQVSKSQPLVLEIENDVLQTIKVIYS
jgi:hypothetical protein